MPQVSAIELTDLIATRALRRLAGMSSLLLIADSVSVHFRRGAGCMPED